MKTSKMNKMKQMALAAAVIFVTAGTVNAHTPLCSCFDNGDDTITCEGGYSDGSSASGVAVRVESSDGKVLQEGAMDGNSEFTFDRPEGEFSVVFDGGEGHSIVVPSKEIVQ
jgi:hypothetical protein